MSGHRLLPSRGSTLVPVLALLLVTVIWGSTFFLIKDVIVRIPAADFLCWRFAVAALAMTMVRPGWVRAVDGWLLRRGLIAGAFLAGGQLLQTYGLARTSASVAGFVTGLYVVMTPLAGAALLRKRIRPSVWSAAVLATAALAVLCLASPAASASASSVSGSGVGELLTFAAAVVYTGHILCLGQWSRPGQAYALTALQMTAVAGFTLPPAVADGFTVPAGVADWTCVLYTGVVAAGVAIGLQTWAQAHLPPARAAIMMTFEPVWAGVFAVALGGEVLSAGLLVGGVLSVAAMLLAETGDRSGPAPGGPDGFRAEIADPCAPGVRAVSVEAVPVSVESGACSSPGWSSPR